MNANWRVFPLRSRVSSGVTDDWVRNSCNPAHNGGFTWSAGGFSDGYVGSINTAVNRAAPSLLSSDKVISVPTSSGNYVYYVVDGSGWNSYTRICRENLSTHAVDFIEITFDHFGYDSWKSEAAEREVAIYTEDVVYVVVHMSASSPSLPDIQLDDLYRVDFLSSDFAKITTTDDGYLNLRTQPLSIFYVPGLSRWKVIWPFEIASGNDGDVLGIRYYIHDPLAYAEDPDGITMETINYTFDTPYMSTGNVSLCNAVLSGDSYVLTQMGYGYGGSFWGKFEIHKINLVTNGILAVPIYIGDPYGYIWSYGSFVDASDGKVCFMAIYWTEAYEDASALFQYDPTTNSYSFDVVTYYISGYKPRSLLSNSTQVYYMSVSGGAWNLKTKTGATVNSCPIPVGAADVCVNIDDDRHTIWLAKGKTITGYHDDDTTTTITLPTTYGYLYAYLHRRRMFAIGVVSTPWTASYMYYIPEIVV